MRYVSKQCARCQLRFPVGEASKLGQLCPRCGAPTKVMDEPYESHEAHDRDERAYRLETLLDNIRSLRNVGSMFRTADGAGVGHMHLCGVTPTPDHPQMQKTALGAERSVPWTHHPDPVVAAEYLRSQGHRLWALEAGPASTSFYQPLPPPRDADDPCVVLVLGHEVSGVDPRVLDRCEHIFRLPMLGVKGSLNVSVAFGIAVYHLRFAGHRDAT